MLPAADGHAIGTDALVRDVGIFLFRFARGGHTDARKSRPSNSLGDQVKAKTRRVVVVVEPGDLREEANVREDRE